MSAAIALEPGLRFAAELMELERTRTTPAWLSPVRHAALMRFGALGLPTMKDERWRYSNLRRLAGLDLALAPPLDLASEERARLLGHSARLDGYRLVFLNGRLAPELSELDRLPRGVRVASLSPQSGGDELGRLLLARLASFEEEPFVALNTALFSDGAFVLLDPGAVLDRPLSLLFVSRRGSRPSMAHGRVLIAAGRASRGVVAESHLTLDGGAELVTAVSELLLDEGAELDHVRLHEEREGGMLIARTVARQDAGSRLRSFVLGLGGTLTRDELVVQLKGPGAVTTLDGVGLGRGRQQVDLVTHVEHVAPGCRSDELYKSVLCGQALGTFHGRVVVRPGAVGTSAAQTNRNLLLSRGAAAHTRPQLEINNQEVRCTHGATVGQLDPDALFYLRSRGLAEREARRVLARAFVGVVLHRAPHPALESLLSARVDEWLSAASEGGAS